MKVGLLIGTGSGPGEADLWSERKSPLANGNTTCAAAAQVADAIRAVEIAAAAFPS